MKMYLVSNNPEPQQHPEPAHGFKVGAAITLMLAVCLLLWVLIGFGALAVYQLTMGGN